MTIDSSNSPGADDAPPPKFYPRLYRRLRLAKWLALVGGVGMLAMGGYEVWRGSRLKSEGIAMVGKLYEQSTVATGKGRTSYRVVLDYQPPNGAQVYRKEFVVSPAVFDQTTKAGQATVTYLPDNPETSVVGNSVPIEAEPLAIGVGLLLFSAAVWYYQRREWQKIHAYITGKS